MCNINKNHLLTLYFHEGTAKEEQKIQSHVNRCDECRDYLLQLEQTDNMLIQWKEEKPLPNTLDLILGEIPLEATTPVELKTSPSITPLLALLFSIIGLFIIISISHDKVTILPFWSTLKDIWPVRAIGSFGVMMILFFILGIFITLALTPVLIMEIQSKKHRYYFG
jgi:hypothetical protein